MVSDRAAEFQSFSVCLAGAEYEVYSFADREEAVRAAETAHIATGLDLYIDPRREPVSRELPTRRSDEDEMELARATVRLSDLSRAASTPDQLNAVLGLVRDLATGLLAVGPPHSTFRRQGC